jgi:hypothetical protein
MGGKKAMDGDGRDKYYYKVAFEFWTSDRVSDIDIKISMDKRVFS